MHHSKKAFTIVELAIVIAVIGILAAISVVAYSHVQKQSRNAARVAEAKQWANTVSTYITMRQQLPHTSSTAVCLGEGFPDANGDGIGDCWDVIGGSGAYRRSVNATVNGRLATVGTLPSGAREPVVGVTGVQRLGPALSWEGSGPSTLEVVYWQEGSSSDDCPVGHKRWSDGRTYQCRIVAHTIPGTI